MGSAAERLGMHVGDEVVKVNGVDVSLSEISRVEMLMSVVDIVALTIARVSTAFVYVSSFSVLARFTIHVPHFSHLPTPLFTLHVFSTCILKLTVRCCCMGQPYAYCVSHNSIPLHPPLLLS
jgi:hypothetical protein